MIMRPVVLLTNGIDAAVARQLEEKFTVLAAAATDADSLCAAAKDAHYIVVRSRLSEELFAKASLLRGVVRHGAGLDMIPMDVASAHGVAVANVPAVNAKSVAEYAVAQMLALMRQLPEIETRLRAGEWDGIRTDAERHPEMHGKTVAVVGMGAVGGTLARICRLGFGMRVIGVRRQPSQAAADAGVEYLALESAVQQADFLVLACPLNATTRHLINAKVFAQAQKGLLLVNVARGAVVDTVALLQALERGQIAGAALDVFEVQPLPLEDRLRKMARVRLTPHLAGITSDSMRRMSEEVAAQLLQMHAGSLPSHLCNPEAKPAILARWARLNH